MRLSPTAERSCHKPARRWSGKPRRAFVALPAVFSGSTAAGSLETVRGEGGGSIASVEAGFEARDFALPVLLNPKQIFAARRGESAELFQTPKFLSRGAQVELRVEKIRLFDEALPPVPCDAGFIRQMPAGDEPPAAGRGEMRERGGGEGGGEAAALRGGSDHQHIEQRGSSIVRDEESRADERAVADSHPRGWRDRPAFSGEKIVDDSPRLFGKGFVGPSGVFRRLGKGVVKEFDQRGGIGGIERTDGHGGRSMRWRRTPVW